MSISRAFTNRRVKQSIRAAEISENSPQRSNSIRNKISSPVQLLHTTNMLSYNAPDIHPMSASSTSSSPRSDDDMSDSALTAGTTPPTSPDVESSSKRSLSPAPNHLSSHFILADRQKPSARPEAPVIPQRALSQPRKPNTLVRQRSASNMSQQSRGSASTKASFSFSRSSSTSTSTSVSSAPPYNHHKPKLPSTAAAPAAPSVPISPAAPPSPPRAQPPPRQQPPPPRAQQQQLHQQQHRKDYSESQHPFGPELAQVSEIAEEYGVKEHLASALELEEREMTTRGLRKFTADDYLSEVRALFANFMAPPRPVAAAWI